MLKLARNTTCYALALALLLPSAHGLADPRPSKSFKSGFSSQRSSSSSSRAPSAAPRGGFGSFGRGAAPPDARRSDSALSRKLDRDASASRALRTLDERRAAQAARNAPPQYDQGPRSQPGYQPGYGQGPQPGYQPRNQPDYGPYQQQVPARRDSGLGPLIAGAVIGNMAANAHANARNNSQTQTQAPAPMEPSTWNGGVGSVNGAAPAASGGSAAGAPTGTANTAETAARGGSLFGMLFTLALLAAIVWGAFVLVRRVRSKRKTDKPNYSFERN
jgi:hypothetical protein